MHIFLKVRNIVVYYNIYCDVKPKRDALEEANNQLLDAQKKLADVQAKVCVAHFLLPISSSTDPRKHTGTDKRHTP